MSIHPGSPDLAKGSLTTNIIAPPQLMMATASGYQRWELQQQPLWTLGRHKDNEISIRDSGASRHHARIDVLQDYHCLISDLHSRNGTRINGQLIAEPVLLKHGDRIQIGKQDLIFQHSALTVAGLPLPSVLPQVLMLHNSALQGKIWQEVLFSQNISAVWGEPGTELKSILEVNALAQSLPKLLLVDVCPYRNTYLEFCHWCFAYFPQVTVVLIDRKPDQGHSQPADLPANSFHFPAFPEANLTAPDNLTRIVEQAEDFLQQFHDRRLRRPALMAALSSLEQLFQRVPAFATLLPSPPISPEQDEETDFFFIPAKQG